MFVTTLLFCFFKPSYVSLKKNLTYSFLLSFSQVLFPLLSIPYISRILEPAGIGAVTFIDSLTYYFIVIAEFGIVSYGIREVARKRKDKAALDKLVSELLSLHLITSSIAVLIYAITVFFLYQKVGDIRLLLFSFSFLLVNAFACEWYFWGTEKFEHITIRTLFTRLLGLISLFVLVKKPEDFIIYYAIICLTAIITIIWNGRKMFSEVTICFHNLNRKAHVPFIVITYLISLVYSVPLLLDTVVLGLVSTTAAVAYYAFAVKIVRISTALITDSFLVFYPNTVSLVHQKNEAQLEKTIRASSSIVFIVAIPLCLGTFLLAKDFTAIYFGKAFMPVAANLQILSFFPLIKGYSLFLNKQLLMPYDLDKLVLKALVAGMIAFLTASLILCYYFGSMGACMATVFSETIVLAYTIYYTKKRRAGIKCMDKRNVSQAIVSSLVFIPVVYTAAPFIENTLLKVVLVIITCIILYFMLLLKVFKNKIVTSFYRIAAGKLMGTNSIV